MLNPWTRPLPFFWGTLFVALPGFIAHDQVQKIWFGCFSCITSCLISNLNIIFLTVIITRLNSNYIRKKDQLSPIFLLRLNKIIMSITDRKRYWKITLSFQNSPEHNPNTNTKALKRTDSDAKTWYNTFKESMFRRTPLSFLKKQ